VYQCRVASAIRESASEKIHGIGTRDTDDLWPAAILGDPAHGASNKAIPAGDEYRRQNKQLPGFLGRLSHTMRAMNTALAHKQGITGHDLQYQLLTATSPVLGYQCKLEIKNEQFRWSLPF
jgi:hypothetical protein